MSYKILKSSTMRLALLELSVGFSPDHVAGSISCRQKYPLRLLDRFFQRLDPSFRESRANVNHLYKAGRWIAQLLSRLDDKVPRRFAHMAGLMVAEEER